MTTENKIVVELTEQEYEAISYCVNVVFLDSMREAPEIERRKSYRNPKYLEMMEALPDVAAKFRDWSGESK